MSPLVVVHRDATLLAQAVAARIITVVVDAQAARGAGLHRPDRRRHRDRARLRELAELAGPGRDRLAAAGRLVGRRALPAERAPGPQRDPGPRGAAGLGRRGPGPGAPDAGQRRLDGDDLDAAAGGTPTSSPRPPHPEDHGAAPSFDILLLGVGPDGHVASLFPEAPALYDERRVIPVRGAPKPPPTRISLSLATINTRPGGLADRRRRGEGRRGTAGAVRRRSDRDPGRRRQRPGGDPVAARPRRREPAPAELASADRPDPASTQPPNPMR